MAQEKYSDNPNYVEMRENVTCNLCGADDYDIIYQASYDTARPVNIQETFRSSSDEILVDQLVRCRHCRLQYLNPRLRYEFIEEGYRCGSDETFIAQEVARKRTFARNLDFIEQYVSGCGRILDIGTAGGTFLHVAKERGWEVSGCEPNIWMSHWCASHYGITVTQGTIFDMQIDGETFDVVTLWDVLEHTPNPKSVLKECNRILKPGGLLILNYPDIGSMISRLMGRKWVFLLSVHLYYFTASTISAMLRETGFTPINHRKHWQWLNLGYILQRMQKTMPVFSKILAGASKLLNLQNVQMPYWMGQTTFVARK